MVAWLDVDVENFRKLHSEKKWTNFEMEYRNDAVV
jgi:hypothetical protein